MTGSLITCEVDFSEEGRHSGYLRVPHSTHFQNHENGGYLSVVNSFGVREDEVPVERVDGRPRLVVLGDSFTFGTGVEAADRYTERLRGLLPEWDILNFGLTGSGVDQQLLLWRKFASGIDHDAVLLAPWAENIRRNAAKFRLWSDEWVGEGDRVVWMPKPYFVLGDDGSLTLEHVPCPEPEPFADVDAADADQPSFNWLRMQIRKLGPGVKEKLQRLTRVQPVPEYGSADGYVAAFEEATAAAVEGGFLLQPDADQLLAEADANRARFG